MREKLNLIINTYIKEILNNKPWVIEGETKLMKLNIKIKQTYINLFLKRKIKDFSFKQHIKS